MADIVKAGKHQSTSENRIWDVDFTDDLRSAVTVSSATATHYPPSGTAQTPTVGTISSNIVPVRLSGLLVTGKHYLDVAATLSDSEVSVVRIEIDVNF